MVEYVVGLEERMMFEGYCLLDYDIINYWVIEYSFNILNDGSRFIDNFYVYIYQFFCQEYWNNIGNIIFIFKVSIVKCIFQDKCIFYQFFYFRMRDIK